MNLLEMDGPTTNIGGNDLLGGGDAGGGMNLLDTGPT